MTDHQVYLLAAGDGKRAGGPKAWLEHEGVSLLKRQIDFLKEGFEASRIAVTMQLGWHERCKEISEEVCWVPENPNAPMLAAVQALLKSQPMRAWAFLYHVDMPVWEPNLFESLQNEIPQAAAAGEEAIVPAHQGKGGHPVLLSPGLADPLLALDPESDRLDRFLHARNVRRVDVPFSCVLENWNEGVEGG